MKQVLTGRLKPAFDFAARLLRDNLPGVAAQTSFYLLFSLFPLLIFTLSILGSFEVRLMRHDLEFVLPPQLAGLLELAPDLSESGAGSAALSVAVSLWSASRGIWALMRGVHVAFNGTRLPFNPRTQALTLALTLCFGLALALSVVLWLTTSGWAAKFLSGSVLEGGTPLRNALGRTGAASVVFLFVWLLYVFTPGCKTGRRAAPVGSCAATAVWLGVNAVFDAASGLIFQDNPLYGGVNAFLAVAMWLYVVSAGIILGAEINASLARRRR